MTRSGVVRSPLLLVAAVALSGAPLLPAIAQETPAVETPAPAVDATGLSEKEKALLQKINALKAPRWRPFGACRYDWAGWKLQSDGVRTTSVQCGPATGSVAVHCDTLKLSVRTGDQAWSGWRLPFAAAESKERGGEDLMVATLCANAKPIPKPQPITPPAVNPAAKPTATPVTKTPTAAPAKKPPVTKP